MDSTALTTIGDGTFGNEAVLQGLERVTGVFSITSGSPNVRGTVEVTGKIAHGDAYLDFDAAGARVKVLGGGIYETVNVSGGYGVRQFGGGYGVSVESGGTFRTSGGSFQFNVGNAPTLDVNGGTVEVTGGPLLLNTGGTFTNARLKASAGKSLVFTNTTNIAVVGTLTGTGAGTVSLQDNAVVTADAADAAGATLAFAPGVLQWSGEAVLAGGRSRIRGRSRSREVRRICARCCGTRGRSCMGMRIWISMRPEGRCRC